jgi:hypothetical protein
MPKIISPAFEALKAPSIKTLTRLEPCLTTTSLAPGLVARIADPAWLLARQHQFGELRGEDAATPVHVELELELVAIAGLDPSATPDVPLEPGVEAQDVAATPGRVRLAAELGLDARRVLLAAAAEPVWAALQAAFPLAATAPDAGLRLLARRSLDGLALARARLDAAGLATLTGQPASGLGPAAAALLAWQAGAAAWAVPAPTVDPWDPNRLEHRFALRSVDGELDLPAGEYPGGRLDWHSVDIAAPARVATTTLRHAAVPLPIQFPGMPAPRWWDLEDDELNLADLEAGPEDMIRMLAVELMTSFADDWYLVPVRLPFGHLVRVARLAVRDTFSGPKQSTAVASFAQHDGPRRTFRMFELTGQPALAAGDDPGPGPWLFLAPTLADPQESEPVEEVRLLRDETSNLGWAVERTLEGADGRPRRHAEPRREPPAPRGDAGWAWQLASAVPRGWIPLAPVPTGDGTHMALRRARLAHWAPDEFPSALLLAPGRKLVVPEEELPAGGVVVTRTWQRARGPAGEVLLWQGREKRPGSGEPTAELLFDRLLR